MPENFVSTKPFAGDAIRVLLAKILLTGGGGGGGPVTGGALASGSVSLSSATNSGSVTGLNLPSTPKSVVLTVQAPAGGANIFATLSGTPTTNGFNYTLSANPPAAGYVLSYVIY